MKKSKGGRQKRLGRSQTAMQEWLWHQGILKPNSAVRGVPDSGIKICFGASACEDTHWKGCAVACFPGGASGKELTSQCRRCKRRGFDLWVGKIPWRRAQQPTPVLLSGESRGQRSLVSYRPWGHKGSEYDWSDLACIHTEGRLSNRRWRVVISPVDACGS